MSPLSGQFGLFLPRNEQVEKRIIVFGGMIYPNYQEKLGCCYTMGIIKTNSEIWKIF